MAGNLPDGVTQNDIDVLIADEPEDDKDEFDEDDDEDDFDDDD